VGKVRAKMFYTGNTYPVFASVFCNKKVLLSHEEDSEDEENVSEHDGLSGISQLTLQHTQPKGKRVHVC
jgi:hypothetical protein